MCKNKYSAAFDVATQLGANARFRVRRGDRPRHAQGPVVRFQNVATGKFLAIKEGQLTTGGGGTHCEVNYYDILKLKSTLCIVHLVLELTLFVGTDKGECK